MTGYAPPLGLPALRETIAASLSGRGITARADRVAVTPGAKPMIFYATQALVEPGDEVLVPDPGFPIYGSAARWAGARVRTYPCGEGCFLPDVDALESALTDRTRLVYVNTPHNPTGSTASLADLQRIAQFARRNDLYVISDEVYSEIRFDGHHLSIAALPGMADRTVVVDGFSKSFAMTGWRLGYGYLPEHLVDPVGRMIVNTVSCVPPFVQHAGAAALADSGTCFESLRTDLQARRDLLVSGLNSVDGVECRTPVGTFYAFPRIRNVLAQSGITVDQFATRLLDLHNLAVLPGTAFGSSGGEHIRLSFSLPFESLEKAVDRLGAHVQHLTGGGR